MEKIFIQPAKVGNIVLRFDLPGFPQLKQEGEWVEVNPQWLRYLRAGDVVEAEPPKAAKPKKGGGE